MKKIALFDVDFTLIKIDSFLLFLIFIVGKYPFKLIFVPYLLFISFLRIFRVVSMEFFKQSWLIFINGFSIEILDLLCKEFFEKKIIPVIKPGVLEDIVKYKESGYSIVLATASFEFYIKYFKDYFKADYIFGTRTLKKDGKMISLIDGKNCKGKEKIKRIKTLIPKEEVDIQNSVSFSDSKSDLPFLELTNTFNLVNPSKWEVIKTIKNI